MKLKPCPYCGESKIELAVGNGFFIMECGWCGASFYNALSPDKALEQWNSGVDRVLKSGRVVFRQKFKKGDLVRCYVTEDLFGDEIDLLLECKNFTVESIKKGRLTFVEICGIWEQWRFAKVNGREKVKSFKAR